MRNGKNKAMRLDDDLIVRYLLGDASGEQARDIEELYFKDPASLSQIECVEDDLIEAYIGDELGDDERLKFETYFLASPGRRERVALARALAQNLSAMRVADDINKRRESRSSLPGRKRLTSATVRRFAIAASIALLAGVCVWLFIEGRGMRGELERIRAEKLDLERQRQELEQAIVALRTSIKDRQDDSSSGPGSPDQPGSQNIATFILAPGLTRNVEELKQIELPARGAAVRLLLAIDNDGGYTNHTATLNQPGGPELWSRHNLKPTKDAGAKVISLIIPIRILASGEYVITLRAVNSRRETEVIGDYAFRVTGTKSR